jgi:hypothetical protein
MRIFEGFLWSAKAKYGGTILSLAMIASFRTRFNLQFSVIHSVDAVQLRLTDK